MPIAGSMLAFMTPYLSDDVSTNRPDPDSLTSLSSNVSRITRDEEFAKVEIGVLTVIFALSFAGNAIVVLALISLARRRKLSRMNTMIGHLALADLFVSFFSVLPQLIWKITFRFQGGNTLCKLVRYVQMVALYSSSYVLLMTALDRYVAICHPLRMHAWTQRRMHFLVVVAWILSFALSSPQLFVYTYDVVDAVGTYDCVVIIFFPWSRKTYVTFFAAAVYVGPLCVLLFLYLRICLAVWLRDSPGSRLRCSVYSTSFQATSSCTQRAGTVARRSQPELRGCLENGTDTPGAGVRPEGVANGTLFERRRMRRLKRAASLASSSSVAAGAGGCLTVEHPRDGISIAKLKTVKLTSLVVGSYFICQGPFFISHAWGAWDPSAPFEEKVMTILLLLASLNSCTNPWIYFAFNDQFSRIFTNVSNRKRMLGRQPSPSTFSTDKDNPRIQLHLHHQQQQQLPTCSVGPERQQSSSAAVSDPCRYSRM